MSATRQVSCWLTFETQPDTVIALQVAAAPSAGERTRERFELTLNDQPVTDITEVVEGDAHGADFPPRRIHIVRCGAGTLRLTYEAELVPAVAVGRSDGLASTAAVTALRQSAYCRSDLVVGFAGVELGEQIADDPETPRRVADWVFGRLLYQSGSSGPTDTAIDTLLAGRGVCRDFAHVTLTMLRALGVPARLVSVYAPGLWPMDFHAVVEALGPQGWEVLDSTRLAPRDTLVRITTGRDAADTAFVTTLRGSAELVASEVFAVTDGILPLDDHQGRVHLA